MKKYKLTPKEKEDLLKSIGFIWEVLEEDWNNKFEELKEYLVSSGGKNIAPLVIEETMKSIPVVSQCFLVGDGRKFCSAIFVRVPLIPSISPLYNPNSESLL